MGKLRLNEDGLRSYISEMVSMTLPEAYGILKSDNIPEEIMKRVYMIAKKYHIGANLDPEEISVYTDGRKYLGTGIGIIIPDDIEGTECEAELKELGFYDAGLRKSGRGYVYAPTLLRDGGYL